MSDKQGQIDNIKKSALGALDQKVRMSAINALAEYGDDGITPITEIVNDSISSEVKQHGMDKITEIKSLKK
ncbi:MAG: hypothetical protein GEU26_15460 [Nitrososphaeraceae archaeon]|nr:hypothetical protein [Nitrososphaeraceae archaeon]